MSSTSSTSGDILLDAGTNELEVLVFRMGDGWFGVNVAKVREVIRWQTPTESPHMHESVLGMINMRGKIIPLVDLPLHLKIDRDPPKQADRRIIITEFNGLQTGFVIDGVEQIHRIGWNKVKPSPDLTDLGCDQKNALSSTTGVLELSGHLVLMLDFESVADSILVNDKLRVDKVENELDVDRGNARVMLAEDSPFMRKLIHETFVRCGYTGIEVFPDGKAAWDAIEATINDESQSIDAIISDIEMPRMDGLNLTRRIKENPSLTHIPVILFSSLISADNLKKGEQVGATLQIPKPELGEMVRLIDKAVAGTLEASNQTV